MDYESEILPAGVSLKWMVVTVTVCPWIYWKPFSRFSLTAAETANDVAPSGSKDGIVCPSRSCFVITPCHTEAGHCIPLVIAIISFLPPPGPSQEASLQQSWCSWPAFSVFFCLLLTGNAIKYGWATAESLETIPTLQKTSISTERIC